MKKKEWLAQRPQVSALWEEQIPARRGQENVGLKIKMKIGKSGAGPNLKEKILRAGKQQAPQPAAV